MSSFDHSDRKHLSLPIVKKCDKGDACSQHHVFDPLYNKKNSILIFVQLSANADVNFSLAVFFPNVSFCVFWMMLNFHLSPLAARCSDLLHLAVLHPRKLSVYAFSGNTTARGLTSCPSCVVQSLRWFWNDFFISFCVCARVRAATAGNVEHGDQYQLKLVYEHNLQRTACNMTYGTFGGVTGESFFLLPFFSLVHWLFTANLTQCWSESA